MRIPCEVSFTVLHRLRSSSSGDRFGGGRWGCSRLRRLDVFWIWIRPSFSAPALSKALAKATTRAVRADGTKIAQEDFCQLSGRSPDSGKNYKYEGSYEEAGGLLKKYCAAYRTESEKLFRQICFNYLFSNGDAHLKNFSLRQTVQGDYLLTPAYDLLCTSMHLPDEARMALDLFDSFESDFFKQNSFYGRTDFLELARRFGLRENLADAILDAFPFRKALVEELIRRSFLSEAGKQNYLARFTDRLRATA